MSVEQRELVNTGDVERRELVIVVGDAILNEAPFTDRRMGVDRHTEATATGQFHVARALIVAEPPRKFGKIQNYFASLIPLAEKHGLVIRILANSISEVAQIESIRQDRQKKSGDGWSVETFESANITDVAETIARDYIGPKQRETPVVTCASGGISQEKRILLRRAFYDCNRVLLKSLQGGKASEGVFLAHAWIAGPFPLRRPLPFFVKFASVSAIEKERQNYRAWVDPYIPFQLRPNVNHRRCVRGSTLSALVGNFVEGAMRLRDACREGLADGVLFSLFEVTLKGIRAQPFIRAVSKDVAGLDVFLSGRSNVKELRLKGPDIIKLARRRLKSTPEEMEAKLCELSKDIPYWKSPIHGDLHDGNVMVRRADAIVIDFGSMPTLPTDEWGPLTADPATLEVSLAFRTDDSDHSTFEEWRTFIDRAYACSPRIRPLNPERVPSSMSWLHRALREIRHIPFGCDCGEKEASLVLAAYLMRFARLPIEDVSTKRLRKLAIQRHAYALVVAERILKSIDQL